MKHFLFTSLLLACVVTRTALGAEPCPPEGYTKTRLLEIKQSGFKVKDSVKRNALAIALMSCVGEPDPEIRDGVVFEGIAGWMREQTLDVETIDVLYDSLLVLIAGEDDKRGFQQPFAALILSEVARTDRVEDSFSTARRAEIVEVATRYLRLVRDYRGFSDSEGWRHGVAHGADLVLQLVLNENINSEQVSHLMNAVATQISPPGETFYIYGEPGRLARAVFYAHRRAVLPEANWQNWFDTISDPTPLENWNNAYSDRAGLARRHNTLAFLAALNVYASAGDDAQSKALATLTMSAIKRVL